MSTDCAPPPTIISTAIPRTSASPNRRCSRAWCRRPRGSRRPTISKARKSAAGWCCERMADTGVISRARAAVGPPRVRPSRSSSVPTGSYFADWVTPYAQQAQDPDFGEVKVRTTLDCDAPADRRSAPSSRAPAGAQAALVAMRPDGRVVAMVGGRSYAQSPFNRVTQARRQPGSAFKLFVYLAAFRAGLDAGQHDRGQADHDRRAGRRRTATASIAARSRCAKRSLGRATRRRCGFPSRSGATM